MQIQPEKFGTVRKAVSYIWVSSGPSGFFLGLVVEKLNAQAIQALHFRLNWICI